MAGCPRCHPRDGEWDQASLGTVAQLAGLYISLVLRPSFQNFALTDGDISSVFWQFIRQLRSYPVAKVRVMGMMRAFEVVRTVRMVKMIHCVMRPERTAERLVVRVERQHALGPDMRLAIARRAADTTDNLGSRINNELRLAHTERSMAVVINVELDIELEIRDGKLVAASCAVKLLVVILNVIDSCENSVGDLALFKDDGEPLGFRWGCVLRPAECGEREEDDTKGEHHGESYYIFAGPGCGIW